ncbi:MAG TPA: LPS export ABC transporter periplasmic protein LptC [Kiritimatiellia bacterium]|nr:LPS export ABC transporter periplasmic protein LptC [Kiritimatiellia bacterium]HMO97630.1 LPS export ABC transporter periplasmic protein LptC [Kiritimatiellia bacterium]HMP95990.1 LPS export ABC transporter periplasmic protein LptC [Kiritimatiellia bacterium]
MRAVRTAITGAWLAAMAAGALWAEDGQIRNFRVPNFDDQGLMTSQIFGEFAKILADGNIEVTELRIEFYNYVDGERRTEMTVTSPRCLLNRNRGMAVSDDEVRISRDEFVVTGKGFTFNNEKQELRILSDSKVVVKGDQRKRQTEEIKRE